jgi:tRNA C32,U32 (ribose-2'-O)-methylase TrmJ
MHRLKRLFNRAHLDQNEFNILRGFLVAVQRRERRQG